MVKKVLLINGPNLNLLGMFQQLWIFVKEKCVLTKQEQGMFKWNFVEGEAIY